MNDLRVCNFLIRYTSNIVRLVNLGECILYEMKSHNYYGFMQTLIPIAYSDLLSKWIWDEVREIIYLFYLKIH
jgi:hypothetical protein